MLLSLALPVLLARGGGARAFPARPRGWLALLGIAAIGGSVPFVLFFEGLSRADATQAAFIHKTLVIWVALIAVPLLGERVGAAHLPRSPSSSSARPGFWTVWELWRSGPGRR